MAAYASEDRKIRSYPHEDAGVLGRCAMYRKKVYAEVSIKTGDIKIKILGESGANCGDKTLLQFTVENVGDWEVNNLISKCEGRIRFLNYELVACKILK
jgi:hypothetical protein